MPRFACAMRLGRQSCGIAAYPMFTATRPYRGRRLPSPPRQSPYSTKRTVIEAGGVCLHGTLMLPP
ncbi:hypothetical protein P3T21_007441 [Paraburkholderia sp. GAS334]